MAWIINDGEYPKQTDWVILDNIKDFVQPYPIDYSIMKVNNDYPMLKQWYLHSSTTEPAPVSLFYTKENTYPTFITWDISKMGACYNTNISNVIIPESVKYIGEYGFNSTLLTTVTISNDCIYYDTSFPENCEIIKV